MFLGILTILSFSSVHALEIDMEQRFKCAKSSKLPCIPNDSSDLTLVSNLLNRTIYNLIKNEMQYTIYTTRPTDGVVFTHRDLELYTAPNIPPNLAIKVIIHGYIWNITYMDNLKDVYMTHYQVIVIVVDWTGVRMELLNPLSESGPLYIGTCIFEMLSKVCQDKYYNKTHLIGHSYGAHIAGHTGRIFREYGIDLERITGLDAANPYIPNGLANTDADFVDVINTSMESTKNITIGHIDFYPNAGGIQPSCVNVANITECNSLISYDYLAESVKDSRKYLANLCLKMIISEQSCRGPTVFMGDDVDVRARGVYYLNTKAFKRVSRIF